MLDFVNNRLPQTLIRHSDLTIKFEISTQLDKPILSCYVSVLVSVWYVFGLI